MRKLQYSYLYYKQIKKVIAQNLKEEIEHIKVKLSDLYDILSLPVNNSKKLVIGEILESYQNIAEILQCPQQWQNSIKRYKYKKQKSLKNKLLIFFNKNLIHYQWDQFKKWSKLFNTHLKNHKSDNIVENLIKNTSMNLLTQFTPLNSPQEEKEELFQSKPKKQRHQFKMSRSLSRIINKNTIHTPQSLTKMQLIMNKSQRFFQPEQKIVDVSLNVGNNQNFKKARSIDIGINENPKHYVANKFKLKVKFLSSKVYHSQLNLKTLKLKIGQMIRQNQQIQSQGDQIDAISKYKQVYQKKLKNNDINLINFRRKSCNTLLFGGIHPFEKITFNLNFEKDYLQQEIDKNAKINENENKMYISSYIIAKNKKKKKKQAKQLKIVSDIQQLKSQTANQINTPRNPIKIKTFKSRSTQRKNCFVNSRSKTMSLNVSIKNKSNIRKDYLKKNNESDQNNLMDVVKRQGKSKSGQFIIRNKFKSNLFLRKFVDKYYN